MVQNAKLGVEAQAWRRGEDGELLNLRAELQAEDWDAGTQGRAMRSV
jgi:hypothetical protein